MNDVMKWVGLAFAVIAVGSAVGVAAWFFINPDGFSGWFDDVNLVAVNTALGVFLIAAGLGLAVLGYTFGVVLNVNPQPAPTAAAAGINLPDTINALTDLLKQAGGLGVAVLLIGVILLTGTALGDAADSSTSSSPTATASPNR